MANEDQPLLLPPPGTSSPPTPPSYFYSPPPLREGERGGADPGGGVQAQQQGQLLAYHRRQGNWRSRCTLGCFCTLRCWTGASTLRIATTLRCGRSYSWRWVAVPFHHHLPLGNSFYFCSKYIYLTTPASMCSLSLFGPATVGSCKLPCLI